MAETATMMTLLASSVFEVPVSYVLTAILSLGTIIATLGVTIFQILNVRINAQDKRMEAQDKMIESQKIIIDKLQDDVKRMSEGCGMQGCTWKHR